MLGVERGGLSDTARLLTQALVLRFRGDTQATQIASMAANRAECVDALVEVADIVGLSSIPPEVLQAISPEVRHGVAHDFAVALDTQSRLVKATSDYRRRVIGEEVENVYTTALDEVGTLGAEAFTGYPERFVDNMEPSLRGLFGTVLMRDAAQFDPSAQNPLLRGFADFFIREANKGGSSPVVQSTQYERLVSAVLGGALNDDPLMRAFLVGQLLLTFSSGQAKLHIDDGRRRLLKATESIPGLVRRDEKLFMDRTDKMHTVMSRESDLAQLVREIEGNDGDPSDSGLRSLQQRRRLLESELLLAQADFDAAVSRSQAVPIQIENARATQQGAHTFLALVQDQYRRICDGLLVTQTAIANGVNGVSREVLGMMGTPTHTDSFSNHFESLVTPELEKSRHDVPVLPD